MRCFGFFSAASSSSRLSWPLAIGSAPRMSRATSPSAMPFTSSGCSPQKSAIWSKVSEVLSTSQTAVAFGMRIWVVHFQVPGTKAPGLSAGRVTLFPIGPSGRAENAFRRLAEDDPAVLERGQGDILQRHRIAAAKVDDRVRARLAERVRVADVDQHVVALEEVEVGDAVETGDVVDVEGVRAQAAGEGVVATVAGEEVVAGAAVQHVVGLAADHRVAAGAAVQGVLAQLAVAEVSAVIAEDGVVALAADHPVVARPAADRVVADVAVHVVEARAADHRVVAGLAAQVAAAARAAVHRVVAGAAVDGVAAVAARQDVVQGVAGHE